MVLVLIKSNNAELLRGKEIFSFSYTKEWLDSGYGKILIRSSNYILAPNIRMWIKIILEYSWIYRRTVGEGCVCEEEKLPWQGWEIFETDDLLGALMDTAWEV